MNAFNETLRSWQTFYFTMGGAAAGLLGLMFVAVSLALNDIATTTAENSRVFVTPSIIYFVSVLLIACVMLVPAYTPLALAVILFLGALPGFVQTARYAVRLTSIARLNQDFILSDWLGQVIVPVCAYGLLLIAAASFASDHTDLGFAGTWLVTIMLLLSAITNTWGLVAWIVERRAS